jgi:hypothetical protein
VLAFLNRKFVEPFRDRVRDLPGAPGPVLTSVATQRRLSY